MAAKGQPSGPPSGDDLKTIVTLSPFIKSAAGERRIPSVARHSMLDMYCTAMCDTNSSQPCTYTFGRNACAQT